MKTISKSPLHYCSFSMLLAVGIISSLQLAVAQAQTAFRSAPESEMVPDAADRQLLERYRTTFQKLNQPEWVGRELLLNLVGERTTYMEEILESERPVSARDLWRARRYFERVLRELAIAQTFSPPPPHVVRKRSTPITIDGRVDEAAWMRADEILIQYGRMSKDKRSPARVRLLWDERYLYAAFTVPDTKIIAPVLQRDGSVWESDCVEMFLLPDHRVGVYWEIEVSPSGSILDFLCYKYRDRWGSNMRPEENIKGLRVGYLVDGTLNQNDDIDKGYSVEIAVPFDQLPGMARGAQAGDKVMALLSHVNRDVVDSRVGTHTLAQAPYFSWFHNIWAYQPLVLSSR